MSNADDAYDPEDRHICHACVGEEYLSDRINRTGTAVECAYCGEIDMCWTIEDLADQVETAFESHYIRTSEDDGEPVLDAIESAANISREVAEAVLAILQDRHYDHEAAKMGEESEFASDSVYAAQGADDRLWHQEWQSFEESLKTEARFFSSTAVSTLAATFGAIDQLKTHDGRPLVCDVGPGTALDHLYRARVFQSDKALEEALCYPDRHLGTPTSSVACAGRMNAHGVSVFYGATEAETAISEVRPPVGSKAAIGMFNLIRPLRLLDLTVIEDVHDDGSIFDLSLKGRLDRIAFLRTLGQRITKPVMPDDEAFDYLATQAVADFLATMNEPRLDGIIFSSAQSRVGRNVVLFHHAARVETLMFPEGTEIKATTGRWTDEGWEADYWVSESVPPDRAPTVPRPGDVLFEFLFTPSDPSNWTKDFRDATLKVDPQSVAVFHVNWVQVDTTRFEAHRHRFEKQKPKF
jgi:hypothetical protein